MWYTSGLRVTHIKLVSGCLTHDDCREFMFDTDAVHWLMASQRFDYHINCTVPVLDKALLKLSVCTFIVGLFTLCLFHGFKQVRRYLVRRYSWCHSASLFRRVLETHSRRDVRRSFQLERSLPRRTISRHVTELDQCRPRDLTSIQAEWSGLEGRIHKQECQYAPTMALRYPSIALHCRLWRKRICSIRRQSRQSSVRVSYYFKITNYPSLSTKFISISCTNMIWSSSKTVKVISLLAPIAAEALTRSPAVAEKSLYVATKSRSKNCFYLFPTSATDDRKIAERYIT